MRKMTAFKRHSRYTAWYCQYGHKTAKPTDLWSNFSIHVKQCKNSNPDCDHERSPRGSATGIQGIEGKNRNYFRSIVPAELCKSILEQIERPIIKRWF